MIDLVPAAPPEDWLSLSWRDPATGLRCVAWRHPDLGFLCGYVGVPKDHPAYGRLDLDDAVDVHGGVTFSELGICADRFADDPFLWYLGFDCGHAWDVVPALPMLSSIGETEYRNFDYVRRECEHLARQLSEMTDAV